MVTCPKCKAENRPEAAFCSRCGTILFAQPAQAQAMESAAENKTTLPLNQSQSTEQTGSLASTIEMVSGSVEPTAAVHVGLQSRPEGTVFGDRFRFDSLLSQGEHEIHYTVTELVRPDSPCVRVCSNPECRTIHCPVSPDPENFCTQCGYPLEERCLMCALHEADSDQFSDIQQVLELNLVHPNIHPPVAAFQEDFNGEKRYYCAYPYSADLPNQAEIRDVLDWGAQLATALDYLHSKGVVLGEEVNLSGFGLADQKAVWRDFSTVRILPMLADREKINNLRLLGLVMYSMMTGKLEYRMDPYLPSALNELFEKALVGEGFTSGVDFIQQIERVKTGGLEHLVLDFQVGRRSHPGKVRTLNEDSLLSMEFSTYQHGGVSPYGLFAVADGMGGHSAGDLASSVVVNSIAEKTNSEGMHINSHQMSPNDSDWFKEIVQAANQAVFEARQEAGNDMGSTLVLCYLVGTQAYITHQGDSRIYLINRESITQLTTDHSLVQHMVNIGQISQDEARNHPQRNVIYRSLGDKPFIEVECKIQQLFPHDRIILCSDGLTSEVSDEKIQEIVLGACSPQAACDQLVEAANSAGGDDNISVIVIEIIPV